MSYLNRLNSLLTSTTSRYDSLRRNILSSSSEDDSVGPLLPLLLVSVSCCAALVGCVVFGGFGLPVVALRPLFPHPLDFLPPPLTPN